MTTEQIVAGAFYNLQLAMILIPAIILFSFFIAYLPDIIKGIRMWFKKSYKADDVVTLLQSNKPKIEGIARNTMKLKGVYINIINDANERTIRIHIDGKSQYTSQSKSTIYGFIKLHSNNGSLDSKLWIGVWLDVNDSVLADDFTSLLKQIELLIIGGK